MPAKVYHTRRSLGKPKLTAIAESTFSISSVSSRPIFSRSRRLSKVRICSKSTTESLVSPYFCAESSICVGKRALLTCEVMAAAITVGCSGCPCRSARSARAGRLPVHCRPPDSGPHNRYRPVSHSYPKRSHSAGRIVFPFSRIPHGLYSDGKSRYYHSPTAGEILYRPAEKFRRGPMSAYVSPRRMVSFGDPELAVHHLTAAVIQPRNTLGNGTDDFIRIVSAMRAMAFTELRTPKISISSPTPHWGSLSGQSYTCPYRYGPEPAQGHRL